MNQANLTWQRQAIVVGLLLLAASLPAASARQEAQEASASGAPDTDRTVSTVETSKLPPEERIPEESFPGLFEPLKSEKEWFWSIDLNQDGQEDLIVLARSKIKVSNAWKTLPIHNPPYEWASRGEIQENPMFEPHYAIRPGEPYLLVFHGGPRGWRDLSIASAWILQDVAEQAPQPTKFGEEDEEQTPGLAIRYQGRPGLLYFAGDRYVVAIQDR